MRSEYHDRGGWTVVLGTASSRGRLEADFYCQLILVLDFSVLVLASVLWVGVLARHQVAISTRHRVKVCIINNYRYNSTFR